MCSIFSTALMNQCYHSFIFFIFLLKPLFMVLNKCPVIGKKKELHHFSAIHQKNTLNLIALSVYNLKPTPVIVMPSFIMEG